MKLTNAEKLILIMLSEIHEKLNIENGIDPKFVQSAIYSGNTWGLEWHYSGIFQNSGETPPIVAEVQDILEMWEMLEGSYEKLSPEDKKRVEVEAEPYGKNVQFRGFDGNSEGDYISVARFLVNDLGSFSTFGGRDLNSHVPSMSDYRRMVAVLALLRPSLNFGSLSAKNIIEILKQRSHP
jgi:uncharacterized protein